MVATYTLPHLLICHGCHMGAMGATPAESSACIIHMDNVKGIFCLICLTVSKRRHETYKGGLNYLLQFDINI